MVTVAEALLFALLAEVAITWIVATIGTAAGAVYKPVLLIVPQATPLQPAPVRVHFTPVFAVPLTRAVNCNEPPTEIAAVPGNTATNVGGTMVTVALADFVASACDVAVTVTVGGVGTVVGAV